MDIDHPRLAVVTPDRDAISESFINAHIEGLLENPVVIWGSPRPLFVVGRDSVLSGVPRALARTLSLGWRMDTLRAHGAVGRRLPMPLYSREMARFLRHAQIDIVLAEYGTTAVEIVEACSISETPLVVHFHGFDAYQEETVNRLSQSYDRLFQTAARIIVVSEDMRERLLGLGGSPERVICNPCGVNVDIFRGSDPLTAPPLLLALGRFVEKKGPLLTLQAFSLVLAEEPDARLVMLGDGVLRSECVNTARQLGIQRKVEFPGPVNHNEVVAWMCRARCFVQHSQRARDGDSEGTPVAVLEASLCGLPVVSTKHGGIVDAVVEGQGGFLVDEGDVEAMAQHILEFIRDPALAATMGEAGRRHIVSNYSAETSLSRLRAVLLAAARECP